jgi:hypothetical protein
VAHAQTEPGPAAVPGVSFQSGPEDPAATNDPTPTFTFTASDPAASLECAVDAAPPEPCDSPFTTSALADGMHSVAVAVAGSEEWATRAFTVDTSIPAVTFTGGPDGRTRERRPVFTFTSAAGSSFECLLDGAAALCEAGALAAAADLADGNHLVVVRATNPAGTTGAWGPRGFTVDTTGPQTVLVSPPPQTVSATPLVSFRADDPGATFECRADGGPFAPCSSPWDPGRLAAGAHRVSVRALDALGNADPSPATAGFTLARGTGPSERPGFDRGVRMLAERLALNLKLAVGAIRETELRTVLRRGRVRVRGIEWLVPGSFSVVARARAARGRPVVLRGSITLDDAGLETLVLRATRQGRALMRRNGSVPLVVSARFATTGLVMSAADTATLARDWITPAEARRAVTTTLRRSYGAGAKNPAIETGARCGNGCLEVRAEWLYRGTEWTARGRAHQDSGRLSAVLAEAVRQPR